MKKKVGTFIFLMLIFCFSMIGNVEVNAASAKSGYCGAEDTEKNVTWNYKNGVLTISGEGAMEDYRKVVDGKTIWFDQPWKPVIKKIKEIKIEEGITYIGSDTFSGCENLKNVSFPTTLKEIGMSAFGGCKNLKDVNLPSDLEVLGQHCFSYCDSIKEISIPDSVTTLIAAFEGCKGLKYAYIGGKKDVPAYVCSDSPFRLCTSLKKIEVSEDNLGLKSVDGVLYSKDGKALIQYPLGKKDKEYTMLKGCTDIMQFAIENAMYLEEIHLSEELQSIGTFAMHSCSKLKKLVIPSNVVTIEDGFSDFCSSLKYIKNLSNIKIKVPYIEGKIGVNADGKKVSYVEPNEKVNIVDKSSVNSSKDDEKKTIKLSKVSVEKGKKQITGKLSLKKATVKVKVGSGKYKKAKVNGKKFTLKTKKLKEGTKVTITVSKKGYKTIKKSYTVK